MIYELWDIETNNLVGDYRTKRDALQVVRNALDNHGRGAVLRLALIVEDQDGESSAVAHGESLIDIALGDDQALLPAF